MNAQAAARQLARDIVLAVLGGLLAFVVAIALWLPALHLFYRPDLAEWRAAEGPLPPKAEELARFQLSLWSDDAKRAAEIERMRTSNAEWDFMGRTYLVLALAEMSLRDPAAADEYLGVIDTIIDETLRLEDENGHLYFLMNYARGGEWANPGKRSLFVDGEIALMLGARRLVEEKPEYRDLMAERLPRIEAQMKAGPVLSGESYPNECWMFCNAVALAALKAGDTLDGTDHAEFFGDWIAMAKKDLVHPGTGLLVSSYTWEGDALDGPEGTSIFMAAHCLSAIDAEFARDQYERARGELRGSVLGFGVAREWPASWEGPRDVDSGPVVPVIEASPGASGLAILGAASFGDDEWLGELIASLNFAAFPEEKDGTLRYHASNQVGDAVILYAMAHGPLWAKLRGEDAP
ncbi:MAG: hypothetical protein PWP23_278 [Candidatus Sumerlaeota bacterium]|nr:hypothetical protein [Candidatus Sumerlaeota bacterium]